MVIINHKHGNNDLAVSLGDLDHGTGAEVDLSRAPITMQSAPGSRWSHGTVHQVAICYPMTSSTIGLQPSGDHVAGGSFLPTEQKLRLL